MNQEVLLSCRECLLTKDIGNVGLVLCWEGKFWSLLLIMDILQLSLGPQHMHRQRTAFTSAWVSAVWGSPTGMPHQEDDSLYLNKFSTEYSTITIELMCKTSLSNGHQLQWMRRWLKMKGIFETDRSVNLHSHHICRLSFLP